MVRGKPTAGDGAGPRRTEGAPVDMPAPTSSLEATQARRGSGEASLVVQGGLVLAVGAALVAALLFSVAHTALDQRDPDTPTATGDLQAIIVLAGVAFAGVLALQWWVRGWFLFVLPLAVPLAVWDANAWAVFDHPVFSGSRAGPFWPVGFVILALAGFTSLMLFAGARQVSPTAARGAATIPWLAMLGGLAGASWWLLETMPVHVAAARAANAPHVELGALVLTLLGAAKWWSSPRRA